MTGEVVRRPPKRAYNPGVSRYSGAAKLIGKLFGAGAREAGAAVREAAAAFIGDKAERDRLAHATREASLYQYKAEFQSGGGRFDRAVDGLNRLPRPLIALGSIALFAYAMAAPADFAIRMAALALAPTELWWLLGAVVAFYFGARELHYSRRRPSIAPEDVAAVLANIENLKNLNAGKRRDGADAPPPDAISS
ncbi:MAG: hypothetical protein Tsb0010_05920 [Parvularculaceae bacterium]